MIHKKNYKIIKNKKGTVAGDIFSGIQKIIDWIINSAPRPLQLIIFLFLLVGLSFAMGFFINVTGNFCDTQGNLYQTGTFSIITNTELLIRMPSNQEINEIEEIDVENYQETLFECGVFLSGLYYVQENGSREPLEEDYYFKDSGRCTKCEDVRKVFGKEGILVTQKYCADDILYPKEYEELSILGKWTCGKTLGACSIPEGYYYSRTTNSFICYEELCKITNETNTFGKLWNNQLKQTGAKIITRDEINERDYRNVVRVDCDMADIHPKLKFFSIELFNYKLWVIIGLLALVIWGVYKIKHP